MELRAPLLLHIGDNKLGGGDARIVGYRGAHQDQNAATRESLAIVVRRAATTGGPDASAAGRLARIGPIQMPPGKTGPKAWLMTVTFAAVTVPGDKTFYFPWRPLLKGKRLYWQSLSLNARLTHIAFTNVSSHTL